MKNRKVFPLIIFAILVMFFVLLNNFGLNPSLKQNKIIKPSLTSNKILPAKKIAKVSKVVDGDTIEVSLNGKTERVRLIGVDSPEVADERKPVRCFGKEASNKAKEVLDGKIVSLESDPTQGEKDRYGRLLRYVFLNDLNFNKFMLSEGYAHEYTYNSNPYKYQLEFRKAEGKARENKKGLWADNVCN